MPTYSGLLAYLRFPAPFRQLAAVAAMSQAGQHEDARASAAMCVVISTSCGPLTSWYAVLPHMFFHWLSLLYAV